MLRWKLFSFIKYHISIISWISESGVSKNYLNNFSYLGWHKDHPDMTVTWAIFEQLTTWTQIIPPGLTGPHPRSFEEGQQVTLNNILFVLYFYDFFLNKYFYIKRKIHTYIFSWWSTRPSHLTKYRVNTWGFAMSTPIIGF